MEGTYETGVSHIRGECMYISSSELAVVTQIKRLAAEFPEDVLIMAYPEANNGCIYAKMPFSFMRISGPRKRELSEEERALRAERLAKARALRKPKTLQE